MKVNIKHPTIKCPICGKQFTKHHHKQLYCSPECSKEAERLRSRESSYRHYHRHKQRINQTRIGTRTIGPNMNPDPDREAEIIENEIQRIGLKNFTRQTI